MEGADLCNVYEGGVHSKQESLIAYLWLFYTKQKYFTKMVGIVQFILHQIC